MPKWSAKFHLQSEARRHLLGTESRNPSIAAASLLGPKRTVQRLVKRATKYRRRFHRGNPAPALLGLLGGIGGKLGKRLKGPEARHAERVAILDALGQRALLGDQGALQLLEQHSRSMATRAARDYAAGILAQVVAQLTEKRTMSARERRAEEAAARREQQGIATERLGILSSAAGQVAGAFARAPKGGLRSGGAAARGVTRVAARVAGTGAVGAVGAAGAAATAAVVIGGLAAGALIGTLLRRSFGEARAVRAEEAAVEGALALRQARTDIQQSLGRKVTAAEARKLFQAYESHLVSLGFVQDAGGRWHRPRSGLERLLG